jgi:carboxymethylenebutenolidase
MAWTTIGVDDGTRMDVYVERPPAERAPAVIVLQEIFGVNSHIRHVTRRVSELGYVAVAPDLFHRAQPRFEGRYDDVPAARDVAMTTQRPALEADLRAVHAWLSADAHVEPTRIAAWGFCYGGRVALRAAVQLPLCATISFYGGMFDGFLDEVRHIHGAVLLAWGGQDHNIPASVRRSLVDALAAEKLSYVNVVFGDAVHGFCCEDRGSYHAPSARQAWELARAFLSAHV